MGLKVLKVMSQKIAIVRQRWSAEIWQGRHCCEKNKILENINMLPNKLTLQKQRPKK